MSKFFYKDRRAQMQDTRGLGYKPKKVARIGTTARPAEICVQTQERKSELQVLAAENDIVVNVIVSEDRPEDISALEVLLQKTVTVQRDKAPARNDPCLCGSGKKYKRCCMA